MVSSATATDSRSSVCGAGAAADDRDEDWTREDAGVSGKKAPRLSRPARSLTIAASRHHRSTMTSRLTILCAGLLSAAAAFAQQPPAAPGPGSEMHAGVIKSAQGDVRVLGPDGSGRAARPGDSVSPIDRVSTGPDSGASVVLRDGTALVLGPDSRVDLKQFHFDATTQEGSLWVSLLRGSMRMITGLIGKTQPDAVRVETQAATIGIRGTDFIVTDRGQP
ncbi:MAG: FecR domain-containing protein [Xenophilus sp.]